MLWWMFVTERKVDMKEYYIWTEYGQWNNMWIVSAKNKKEAIDKVYQKYIIPMNEEIKIKNKEVGYFQYRPCYKKELKVKSIQELHKENEDTICIN